MEADSLCVVCGASDFDPLYNGTLRRCCACGHVAANMSVSKELLSEVYRENYFKGEEYVDYARDKDVLQHNFRRRLKHISSMPGFRTSGNVVEIGCAYGFFGEVLQQQYPGFNYKGYDVVPEACEHAKRELGLDICCGDFLDAEDIPKCAHIFMWDVIEHLDNPHLYLEKGHRSLQDGGKIYITTGDISAVVPKLQKRKWRMIHPPSHLHYFSRHSLTLLLESQGFEVRHVSYPATARSVKQIFYSLFMLKAAQSRFKDFLYRRIPAQAFVSVNTFDIMLIVAEKRQ